MHFKNTLISIALLLSGCAAADMHEARDPFGSIIGMSAADFVECAGKPNQSMQLASSVAILEWDNTATSTKPMFAMTLPMGFSVEAGQPASCHMIATITDTGTVARVEFTGLGVTSDGEACSQMIRSCIMHGDTTSTDAHETFKYFLNPTSTSNSKGKIP